MKANAQQLHQQVNYPMEQMRLTKHRQFGASSEKSKFDSQLNLFNEAETTTDEQVAAPELTGVEKHYRKKAKKSGANSS